MQRLGLLFINATGQQDGTSAAAEPYAPKGPVVLNTKGIQDDVFCYNEQSASLDKRAHACQCHRATAALPPRLPARVLHDELVLSAGPDLTLKQLPE